VSWGCVGGGGWGVGVFGCGVMVSGVLLFLIWVGGRGSAETVLYAVLPEIIRDVQIAVRPNRHPAKDKALKRVRGGHVWRAGLDVVSPCEQASLQRLLRPAA